MRLIGDNNIIKLDDKGRMLIPSQFKKRLQVEGENSFVIKHDIGRKCLILYPLSVWESKVAFLKKTLNEFNPMHNQFISEFFRGTAEVELDNAGRLNMPTKMIELIGVEKEILVKGKDNVLEFWSPVSYEGSAMSPEEFNKLGQAIFGNDLKLEA